LAKNDDSRNEGPRKVVGTNWLEELGGDFEESDTLSSLDLSFYTRLELEWFCRHGKLSLSHNNTCDLQRRYSDTICELPVEHHTWAAITAYIGKPGAFLNEL